MKYTFTEIEIVRDNGERDHWKVAFENFRSNVTELKQADEEFFALQNQMDVNEQNVEFIVENDENANYYDVNVVENVLL